MLEDANCRDLILEFTFEEELLNWTRPDDKELSLLGESFCNHGLIILHWLWSSRHTMTALGDDPDDDTLLHSKMHEVFARRYALDIIRTLEQIPLSSWYLNIQCMPLLTAVSELLSEDTKERKEVLKRLEAMYSMNSCPANVWVYELLEELWVLKDTINSRAT